MALETELKTYHEKLPELLASEGKFVVIHDVECLGTFETYEAALQAGYDKYGMTPFLAKQIQSVEKPLFYARHILPAKCHT